MNALLAAPIGVGIERLVPKELARGENRQTEQPQIEIGRDALDRIGDFLDDADNVRGLGF